MSKPTAGMMVTPNVRLTRPLNEGGMGAVWVAEHLALRTQVVVKFITGELSGNADALARFEREAAAASQVKSPHVVQTFDHGTTADGLPYIVMELLEGEELGDYLDRQGRMSPKDVVALVSQLGKALDRAHAKGIVHRDIKPNNIFLTGGESGEFFVKLLDFGIAKGVDMPKIDSATRTGAVMGSPFYMSPEQIVGAKEVGAKSDLWAVGVVAFECLTGTRPFEAETMGALAIQIHGGPIPKPSDRYASLPAGVDAWFAKACARDPEGRFSSAKEMADALGRAVDGGSGVSVVPGSMPIPSSNTPSGLSSADMFAKTTEHHTPFARPDSSGVEVATGLSATRIDPPLAKKTTTYIVGGVVALALAGAALFAAKSSSVDTKSGATITPSSSVSSTSGSLTASATAPSTPSTPSTPPSVALTPLPSTTTTPSSAPTGKPDGTGKAHVGVGKPHASTSPSATAPPVVTPHPTSSNDVY